MPSLKKVWGVDTKKEKEGVWCDLGHGVRILLARAGNPRAQELTQKKLLALREEHGPGKFPEGVWETLTQEVMAEAVLIGWEGITEEDGTPILYSKEKALEYLSDPSLHDFREEIDRLCGQRHRYALESEEESLKNSKASSSGS